MHGKEVQDDMQVPVTFSQPSIELRFFRGEDRPNVSHSHVDARLVWHPRDLMFDCDHMSPAKFALLYHHLQLKY
jgi:hypothetical protein